MNTKLRNDLTLLILIKIQINSHYKSSTILGLRGAKCYYDMVSFKDHNMSSPPTARSKNSAILKKAS